MPGSNHRLASQQQELLNMIFNMQFDVPDHVSPAFSKGLQIYQNNLLMTATRSLSLTYPVIEKMLGREALVIFARNLLQSSPPDSGIWADWGGQLSKIIERSILAQEYPYLVDMASLEWRMHQSARSAYRSLETSSLSKLANVSPDVLRICLSTSVRLLRSNFPIDDFWFAHQSDDASFELNQGALAQAISHFEGERYLMIYQYHQLSRIKQLTLDEYQWVEDVLKGSTLSELLARYPEFEFSAWLSKAIQDDYLECLI